MQPAVLNPYADLPPHDSKRWVCVYPAYLNARITLKQGRRISKVKAIESPTCSEIRDVCISQNLQVRVEPNHYPRDPQRDQIHSGRVRVQLLSEDGSFCNENAQSRLQLYALIAEYIPKLKSRQTASGGGAEGKGQPGGGGGGKKKKGKRK